MRKLKFAILPGVVIVLVLWAFWWEPASLFNETHDLSLPSWPTECNGLRIAVLSDLHVGSPYNSLSKLEKRVTLWWFNAARVYNALESVGIGVLEDTSIVVKKGK